MAIQMLSSLYLRLLALRLWTVKTYREMAERNPDYIIYNIVNPILARIDTILDTPIRSLLIHFRLLLSILVTEVFVKSIQNLLYPVTKIASPIIGLLTGEVRSENEVKPAKVL